MVLEERFKRAAFQCFFNTRDFLKVLLLLVFREEIRDRFLRDLRVFLGSLCLLLMRGCFFSVRFASAGVPPPMKMLPMLKENINRGIKIILFIILFNMTNITYLYTRQKQTYYLRTMYIGFRY